MKLEKKSARYFLVTSLFVFVFSGVALYFLLHLAARGGVDADLDEQRIIFLHQLQKYGGFEHFHSTCDSNLTIRSTAAEIAEEGIFKDTLISVYDYEERISDLELFRQLTFPAQWQNQSRLVSLRKSRIDNDDLVAAISLSLLLVLFLMIAGQQVVYFWLNRRLWQPFHTTLEQISRFDFRSRKAFQPEPGSIDEFAELNRVLSTFTAKLSHDYFALKEFSENASHEMQTPLAIIRSKLELVQQRSDLPEEVQKNLKSAWQAAHRLSRLHQDLNLLTRIGNNEFPVAESISVAAMLENQLEQISELLVIKNLNLQTNIEPNVKIKARPFLIEVLISNLLSNAIRHNITGGTIEIVLQPEQLIIRNSGPEPAVPPTQFFDRFRKGSNESDSTGLGLAIIKEICTLHKFQADYTYTGQQHQIIIRFN